MGLGVVLGSNEIPGLGAGPPGWCRKVTGSRKGAEWTELSEPLLPLTVSVIGTKLSVPNETGISAPLSQGEQDYSMGGRGNG